MSATHRTKEERLDASDQCYTPPGLARAAVRRLIEQRWFRDITTVQFLEPSCGSLAWVDALLEFGVPATHITANDLVKLPIHEDPKYHNVNFYYENFLQMQPGSAGCPDCIIGNPPFGDLGSHLETALNLVSPMGIVVFLMPVIWFTGREKGARIAWLKMDAKPRNRDLITPRPKFRRVGTDSAAYEIVVWAPGAGIGTTAGILDWYEEREVDYANAKAAKSKLAP